MAHGTFEHRTLQREEHCKYAILPQGDPAFEPAVNGIAFNPNGCDFDPSKGEGERTRLRGTFMPKPRPIWIGNQGAEDRLLARCFFANLSGGTQFGLQVGSFAGNRFSCVCMRERSLVDAHLW